MAFDQGLVVTRWISRAGKTAAWSSRQGIVGRFKGAIFFFAHISIGEVSGTIAQIYTTAL